MKHYLITFLFLITFFNANSQTPNILFVIADDMGTDATNGYFNHTISATTPTLDSLRNIGITFKNVWAYPVCTPTRASIMSGKYGVKTGVLTVPEHLDTSHTSLFKRLKQNSNQYTGAVVGKWHISHPTNPLHPLEHGVDYYMGLLEGFPADYYVWNKTYNGTTALDSTYISETITDSAINWINNQPNKWLMWLAYPSPHTPFHLPPSYMYSISPTGTNYRKFVAMIESVDYELNRVLSSLDSVTRANTVVIFIGDNGTTNQVLKQYPAGRGKGTLYQGGIRVPMIVAGKNVSRAGVMDTSLINVLDIHATILELAGTILPGGINNSLSFKPLLSGVSQSTRDYDYMEINNRTGVKGYTIRDLTYKLIKFDNGTEEFYNLKTDSFELSNLMLGTLTAQELAIKLDLETEASQIRNAWSCKDYIQNGDETGIDCGGTYCQPCLI